MHGPAEAQVDDPYAENNDASRSRFEFSLPVALAALIFAAFLSLPSTADSVDGAQPSTGWIGAVLASVR